VQVEGIVEALDGEGRKGVELAIALFARGSGGLDQRGGIIEFGDQTIDPLTLAPP
jgi:hypothetical protein